MAQEWFKRKVTVGSYLITKFLNKLFFNFKKKKPPIYISPDSTLSIGHGVKLDQVKISLRNGSSLIIEDNVTLKNYIINIEYGTCRIGRSCILTKGNQALSPAITILKGNLEIAHHNNIKANFLIKFGGNCKVGIYNSINEQTEIRCDDLITIGDYNMISYECMLYDTNTHCIYKPSTRRAITKADFPDIGAEIEKPMTSPVKIGNDCWIGKRAMVLKGSILENNTILGAGSILSSTLKNGTIGVGNPAKSIKNITFHEPNM